MLKLELGTELMSSIVAFPHRWLGLLRAADGMRAAAGLAASLALSHNFEHHFQIGEDVVLRLDAAGRTALADLVRGLDAIALSQYMDLTAAMPPAAFAAMPQGGRLPTPSEVAQALALHAAAFKQNILQGLLGLSPSEVPPLHLGEFGVGRGGLRHPNEWDGASTPAQEAVLSAHIARGYEGVVAYLQTNETERGAESATLWITGPHFDVWGWEQPAFANKAAQARPHHATSGGRG